MAAFVAEIQHAGPGDQIWKPGKSAHVQADDAVDAAFQLMREHQLAQGRHRIRVLDDGRWRTFHPGSGS